MAASSGVACQERGVVSSRTTVVHRELSGQDPCLIQISTRYPPLARNAGDIAMNGYAALFAQASNVLYARQLPVVRIEC
jgi:hypothetical protein